MTLSPPGLRPAYETEETTLLDWRRRKNRRRLILRFSIALLVLALLGTGIYLVGFSTVLAVRSVQVTGVRTLTNADVRAIAAVPAGSPLARVDIGAVQHRVAAIKQVESAQVERRWPHTVRIRIVERTAVYAVPRAGEVLLVDRFGVGFLTVPASAAGDLPRAEIDGEHSELLEPLASVVAALPAGLQADVLRIEASGPDSIKLHLTKGRTVFWGSEAESELKAKVIMVLLKQPGDHYDVSAPGNPAIR
jgi:cell division protein FtsQ